MTYEDISSKPTAMRREQGQHKRWGKRWEWFAKAGLLAEALPYMRLHAGKAFVVKYGGHVMGDRQLSEAFARDITLIRQVGINPIIVHGGGPQIDSMLSRLQISSAFINGLRVTSAETMHIVEMLLAGTINKEIVSVINQAGGRAIGLCGRDAHLIQAHKLHHVCRDPDSGAEHVVDLGFVGEPDRIQADVLTAIMDAHMIPVIAPIGQGIQGEIYNINADTAAGAIASAVGAKRMYLLTNVPGVLDDSGQLIPKLSVSQARKRIQEGKITTGMIPKVETCNHAVEQGVEAAVILDGRRPHALLLEIFTDSGVGTLIHNND